MTGDQLNDKSSSTLEAALRQVSARCVCLHARMAARAVTRAYDAALKPLGLESTQFTLLAAIAANPQGSVTALADKLALERSGLSRNLALLQKRGLTEAEKGAGRSVSYRVTDQGRALIASALPLWETEQARHEALLGGAEAWAEAQGRLRVMRKGADRGDAADD